MERRTRWKWLLVEGLVVVASILIAFALDAWWEGRSARVQERAHLRAVAADLALNAQRLREQVGLQERIVASAGALIPLVVGREAVAADSAARLLGPLFTSGRFEPVMGGYQALLGSGELSLVRDDSVRVALARLAAAYGDRYYERFADDIYLGYLGAARGRLRLAEWLSRDERAALGVAQEARLERVEPLLADPAFHDFLVLRHSAERSMLERYRHLLVMTEEVLARTGEAAGR